jgi:ribosomal protein S18 acetylase RimI-like enzyme
VGGSEEKDGWYLPVADRDAGAVPAPSDERTILLAAYDAQLRGAAEMRGSVSWDRDGPLHRAQYEHAGFVSYESLAGVDDVDALIGRTVAYYQGFDHIQEFEWKTRGHDQPGDLDSRLREAGFLPEEVETVMIGEADKLAVDVQLPDGVVIRRVDHLPERAGLVAAVRMQLAVFGGGPSPEEVLSRVDRMGGDEQFWVAEASDRVVCAGRLSRVAGTEFASLWGGATDPEWRGKAIYRALTAARARAAIDEGVRYLHSDCTAMSRPILQRSGMVAVTTTTPYIWRR